MNPDAWLFQRVENVSSRDGNSAFGFRRIIQEHSSYGNMDLSLAEESPFVSGDHHGGLVRTLGEEGSDDEREQNSD